MSRDWEMVRVGVRLFEMGGLGRDELGGLGGLRGVLMRFPAYRRGYSNVWSTVRVFLVRVGVFIGIFNWVRCKLGGDN